MQRAAAIALFPVEVRRARDRRAAGWRQDGWSRAAQLRSCRGLRSRQRRRSGVSVNSHSSRFLTSREDNVFYRRKMPRPQMGAAVLYYNNLLYCNTYEFTSRLKLLYGRKWGQWWAKWKFLLIILLFILIFNFFVNTNTWQHNLPAVFTYFIHLSLTYFLRTLEF